MKKVKKVLSVLCCVVLLIGVFAACSGGGYKKKLVGSWHYEGEMEPSFVLYSDGTCEIDGEYGEGQWEVVNDNVLKLTNYYGETSTAEIRSVKGGKLTLSWGSDDVVYYNAPKN